MVQSKQTAPHATAFEEVDVSKLVALRTEKKAELAEKGIKLSYMPFIMKAVALALKRHKTINCQLDMPNNRVVYQNFYNVGFATDTPDGLIVPVIKNTDRMSIIDIAAAIMDKSERARDRKLTDAELVRAVRFMVAAEYEAIQLYMQLAESIENQLAIDVLKDIADEERVHAGEFLRLLHELEPDEQAFYD